MHTGFKDKNHIYAMEVLNDKGEWIRHMYDIPIDIASIKKIIWVLQQTGICKQSN